MKKLMAGILAAALSFSLLAGCGNGSGQESSESGMGAETGSETVDNTESADAETGTENDAMASLPATLQDGEVKATPEMYPNVDFDKPYTVNLYLIGDTPNDWDRVLEKINEYLVPFNTTLNVEIMGWADYPTMYSLVLAGGEDIDMIYTAPWCYMYVENAKGSFYTYERDFVKENMPLTDKYQAEKSYAEATVNGKIVAIPCNQEKPQNKIVAIRQDIADKYGIEKLETWDDYMNFMTTVAEKETPESGILAQASASNNAELWDVYRQQYDTFYVYEADYLKYIYSYKEGETPSPDDISLAWNTEAFKKFAADMKTLADAGAWSRSALSNTITDDDAFGALQGASIAWNGSVFTFMKTAEKNEGVQCAAYDLTTDHLVQCEEHNNSDMAIAAASKDPIRTAMVLDILKMDTYVNRLITLGIEGEHYTIDGFAFTKGEKEADYVNNSISLSWGVNNGIYEESGQIPREKEMYDAWEERIVSNPTITFVFDDTPVSDYAAACKTVLNDYIPSLQLGLVTDADASLAEMNEKLKASGIEQVEEELFKQYEAWLATR